MSSTRVALAPITDSQVNVEFARRSFAGFGKEKPDLLLQRSASADLVAAKCRSDLLKLTPRQEKARVLKMRLQLAYYKVKTNQTEVPLVELKRRLQIRAGGRADRASKARAVSKRLDTAHGRSTSTPNALTDLLAASSPIFNRKQHRTAKRHSHRTKLDDVIYQRARRAASVPCVPRFGLPLPTLKHTMSVTSPARFSLGNKPALNRTRSAVPPVIISQLNTAASISADADATLVQNTSSMLMTPVKGAQGVQVSSPTRVLSTPSSIGAARCLLQLAHR